MHYMLHMQTIYLLLLSLWVCICKAQTYRRERQHNVYSRQSVWPNDTSSPITQHAQRKNDKAKRQPAKPAVGKPELASYIAQSSSNVVVIVVVVVVVHYSYMAV